MPGKSFASDSTEPNGDEVILPQSACTKVSLLAPGHA